MSVVSGPDFDELKRFNLSEIGMPPASAAEDKSGNVKNESSATRDAVVKAEAEAEVKSELRTEGDEKATEIEISSAPAADDEERKKVEGEASAESDGGVEKEIKEQGAEGAA